MQSFYSRRSSTSRKRTSRAQVVSLGLESLEQRLLLVADGFCALNGDITVEIGDHRTLLINGANVDDKIQLEF